MITVQAFSGLLIIIHAKATSNRTPSADATHSPIGFEQAAAGAIAYGFYVAAAMMAGAQLPEFLRDHLFDGFAPAALVGFLIYRIPNAQPRFATISLFYLLSAAVFGLIAAAAVFSSGKNDFLPPVLSAAIIGGITLISPLWGTQDPKAADAEHAAKLAQLSAEHAALLAQLSAEQAAKLDRLRGQDADAESSDGADTVAGRTQPPAPRPPDP
jgi:hypothetical protein